MILKKIQDSALHNFYGFHKGMDKGRADAITEIQEAIKKRMEKLQQIKPDIDYLLMEDRAFDLIHEDKKILSIIQKLAEWPP